MIIGLSRVRNEAEIIQETLDHMATFCDMIFVYDDVSSDNTAEICQAHPKVQEVVKGKEWDHNRKRAEWQNRAAILAAAKKYAISTDWFVYMDADERIQFNFDVLNDLAPNVVGVKMKLFDYYITDEDKNLHYSRRKYIGPEYRNILMLFKNLPTLSWCRPDQREVHLNQPGGKVVNMGFVKHYGKAISIQQWEDTCVYYGKFFPKYSAKWNARRGKAIHTVSSFGSPLITWEEKEAKGCIMTKELQTKNIYE